MNIPSRLPGLSLAIVTAILTATAAVAQTIEVTSAGVGIGTAAPTSKLVVKPTSDTNQLSLWQYNWDGGYDFKVSSDGSLNLLRTTVGTPRFYIDANGNVGIGTASPGQKLEVAGSVRATSFIANSNTYADFVFKPGYKLASLSEVENHIKNHGHLPDVPSEAEARAKGIDLAAMQVKLLQKVEELTLYAVAHEKELAKLRAENATLHQKIADLEKR